MQNESALLMQRLAALESRVRRQSWVIRSVALVVFLAAAGSLLMAQAANDSAPRTVTAERIELTDATGKLRAVLGVRQDMGVAALWVLDQEGRDRASLAATNESTGLILKDREGQMRIAIMLDTNGSPKFNIYDANGRLVRDLQVVVANSNPGATANSSRTPGANAANPVDDGLTPEQRENRRKWREGKIAANSIRQALDVYRAKNNGKLPDIGDGPLEWYGRLIKYDYDSLNNMEFFAGADFSLENVDAEAGTYTVVVRGSVGNAPRGTYKLHSNGREEFSE